MSELLLPDFNDQLYVMDEYHPPLDGRRDYDGDLADFNELVCPPSQAVLDAITAAITRIQVYPEYSGLLEERAAFYAGVGKENVMVTNGSDQAIQIIGRSVLNPDKRAIVPQPTFAMLRLVAQETGAELVEPYYDVESQSYPTEEVLESITDDTGLITVCSPNNPTGTITPLEDIERIAAAAPQAIVLVDEAYYDFSKVTAIGLAEKYPNIVVTRTFSKAFGIPALRMGYMMGREDTVAEIAKLRGPYDINQIGYEAATAALSDEGIEETARYIEEVNTQSLPMLQEYLRTARVPYWDSAANFVLVQALRADGSKDAKGLVAAMDKERVRIREQRNKLPQDPEMVRISVGDAETTKRIVAALKAAR